jgi:hypothetical protein
MAAPVKAEGAWANIEDGPPVPSRVRGESKPVVDLGEAHLPAATRLAILSAVAPERSEAEVLGFRRDVVAAGKTKHFDIPSQVTPKFVCKQCGNRDQRHFLHEPRAGDVVCLGKDASGCGNVVEEHKMFEGAQYRKFEGEDDKSHHGPAPNKLYSAAHNMRPSLAPMSGGSGARASRLRQADDRVELGLSNLGNDERRTRVGYKDAMKRRAFESIVHVSANLALHASVVGRAQELFANFRDEREYVQRLDAVLAACLVQAAEEAAADEVAKASAPRDPSSPRSAPPPPVATSKRARLLAKPLASAAALGAAAQGAAVPIKRKRSDDDAAAAATAPAKRTHTIRAGKGWAAALDDLDELEDED